MLQFDESVSFLLELVDLALVGQQVVVLEVLVEIQGDRTQMDVLRRDTMCVYCSILCFIFQGSGRTSYCLRVSEIGRAHV